MDLNTDLFFQLFHFQELLDIKCSKCQTVPRRYEANHKCREWNKIRNAAKNKNSVILVSLLRNSLLMHCKRCHCRHAILRLFSKLCVRWVLLIYIIAPPHYTSSLLSSSVRGTEERMKESESMVIVWTKWFTEVTQESSHINDTLSCWRYTTLIKHEINLYFQSIACVQVHNS